MVWKNCIFKTKKFNRVLLDFCNCCVRKVKGEIPQKTRNLFRCIYCTFLSKSDLEKNIKSIVTVQSFDGAKMVYIEDKKVQNVSIVAFLAGRPMCKILFHFLIYFCSQFSVFFLFFQNIFVVCNLWFLQINCIRCR